MAIYGTNADVQYVVLGISFLSDYYSIYDLSNLRVGFIKADPDAGVLTFERFMFVFAAALAATAILSCGCFCCCCCLCKPCRYMKDSSWIRVRNQAKIDAAIHNMSLMTEDAPDRIFGGSSTTKLPIDRYNKTKHGMGHTPNSSHDKDNTNNYLFATGN